MLTDIVNKTIEKRPNSLIENIANNVLSRRDPSTLGSNLSWEATPQPTTFLGKVGQFVKEKIGEPVVSALTGMTERERNLAELGGIPSTRVRLPFQKEATTIRPVEAPLLSLPISLAGMILEAVPKFAVQTTQNYRELATKGEADPLKMPFDARRLGFDSPEIESTGRRLWEKYDEINSKNPPKSELDVWKNAGLASLQVAIPDAFDAFIAGSVLETGAKMVLKTTKYDPMLERSLTELGMPRNKVFNEKEFVERVNKSLSKTVREGNYNDFVNTIRSTKYVVDKYMGEGIPALKSFIQKIENVAKDLALPIQQVGRGFQVGPIAGRTALPGATGKLYSGYPLSDAFKSQITNLAKKGVKPETIAKQLGIAKPAVESFLGTAGKEAIKGITPKDLEPLAQEAIKYPSADEFLKAQPTYYHATPTKNVSSIEQKGFSGEIGKQSQATSGDMQKGVFLYPEKDSAEFFKRNFDDASIIETKVNGKVYDANTQTKYGWEDDLQITEIAKDKKIVDQLRKDGFVGVQSTEIGTDATFIFEPKSIKTKSQLKEIWNKEVKGVKETPPTTISQAKKELSKVSQSSILDTPAKAPKPQNITTFQKIRENIIKPFSLLREQVQDDMLSVKKIVEDPNIKITEASDPYQAEILFHGRVGSKIEDLRDTIKSIDQDIVKISKEFKVESSKFTKEVNDFLIARHAPERNAALYDGAAGITTKNARAKLKEISNLSYAKKIQKVAQKIQELNTKTLDTLKEGEVIDNTLYNFLKNKYKNHIPLQRVLETEDDFAGALAKGFDVKGAGIIRAKGSEKEVMDVIGNVAYNLEQAIIRAEKNRVDLATFKMVKENSDRLSDLFTIRKPKAIGKDWRGKPIMERVTDPSTLVLRKNGKPIFIEIKDPSLAVTLRGIGRQKMSGIMRGIAAISRFYSGLHTRFNPEFAFSNKIRDMQEVLVYAGAQKELGIKGTAKIAMKEAQLQNIKSVQDWLFNKNTEGARLYQQIRMDGGTTGGLGLSTRKAIEVDINKIRKLNRSKPKAAAEKFLRLVDAWNTVFEDSTRLSVYREALNNGATRQKAARLAKESSVNFNKFGKQGPIINALWIFSNASIQGTAKMLMAMRKPKVAATVGTAVFGSVATTSSWNDQVDPDWRNKVTTWDRLNGLPIMIPSKEGEGIKYFVIPVSWGIKPIKVMSDQIYDSMTDKGEGLRNAMGAIMVSIIEAYNPAGGSDIVSSITPTIIDIPIEIARNQAWHGGQIRPDWDKNAPGSIQYFSSLRDSTTGRISVGISKGLSGKGIEVSPANINYAYEQIIGGAGRAISKTVNTITAISKEEEIPTREIPVVSRFFKKRPEEEVGGGSIEFNQIQKSLQKQSLERFYLKQQAEDSFRQLSELSKEDAIRLWNEINREDPALAKKIGEIKKQEDKGLTFIDRQILQLGVENEERANFLVQKFSELKTKEEKSKLWEEYVRKGILTDRVKKQFKEKLKK